MKLILSIAAACLLTVGAAQAQDSGAQSEQPQKAEWQTLLMQARGLSNVEFRKPFESQNYNGVLAITTQAQLSALKQFGEGSPPHLATMIAHDEYLGFARQYDKQLSIAKKIFAFRINPFKKNSIEYAKALVLFANDLTAYHDGHQKLGTTALQNAKNILVSHGDINNADLAEAWLFYAVKLTFPLFYGLTNDESTAIIGKVVAFREQENPKDFDRLISTLEFLALYYKNNDKGRYAFDTYKKIYQLSQAEGSGRFEGEAFYNLGDISLQWPTYTQEPWADYAKSAEIFLKAAVALLAMPKARHGDMLLDRAKARLADAQKVNADLRAQRAADRRAASANAAATATRNGQIAPTPGLNALIGKLRAAGVAIDMAGLKR